MVRVSMQLLGRPRVTLWGAPVQEVHQYRGAELLAYLAIEAGQAHLRETLAGLLWPEAAKEAAGHNLREGLFRLRRGLGENEAPAPVLEVGRREVRFRGGPDCWIDVIELTHLIEACRIHDHRRVTACRPCLRRLEQAVALYHGPLLEPASATGEGEYARWLALRREWIHREVLEALAVLSDHAMAAGQLSRAHALALRQVELEPYHEEAHRRVMRALALEGQRGAALAQYAVLCERLERELGVEPEDETEELYQQILHGESIQESGAGRGGSGPVTPTPIAAPIHNLPAQPSAFFGREEELELVAYLLEQPGCRLITVVGPGGAGKTRLAIEAASSRIGQFRHGVFLVPLEAVEHVDQVPLSIAAAMRVPLSGPTPPRIQLQDWLAGREALIVLDNFEHLVEAAGWVGEMLAACPKVKLLVTSRERLLLRAEHLVDLAGLPFPEEGLPLDEIGRHPAVQLWVARSRQVRPKFRLEAESAPHVTHICRLVQGFPLAIELAAAAMRDQSCAEVAARLEADLDLLSTTLRDVPPHHRSMQVVFDRSWSLLRPRQRTVLSRLAIFQGSFDLDAAKEIGLATRTDLDQLAARSLLRPLHAGRFTMHELVRRFALSRLEEVTDGREALGDRHARHFAARLELEAAALQNQSPPEALERVAIDAENLRAAWEWAVAHRHLELIETLARPYFQFLQWRGWFHEGRRLFEGAVRMMDDLATAGTLPPAGPRLQARCCGWLGLMTYQSAAADEAIAWLERGVASARACQERPAVAWSQQVLGAVLRNLGEVERARACLEESAAWYQRHGPAAEEAEALFRLSGLMVEQGELEAAHGMLETCLERYQAAGNRVRYVAALTLCGLVEVLQGRGERGLDRMREALRIHREQGVVGLADTLSTLCHAFLELGRYREARRHARECVDAYRQLRFAPGLARGLFWLTLAACELGELEEAGRAMRALFDAAIGCRSPLAAVEAVTALLRVRVAERRYGEALEAAAMLLARGDGVPSGVMRYATPALEALRDRLPAAEIEAAVARARALPGWEGLEALYRGLPHGEEGGTSSMGG